MVPWKYSQDMMLGKKKQAAKLCIKQYDLYQNTFTIPYANKFTSIHTHTYIYIWIHPTSSNWVPLDICMWFIDKGFKRTVGKRVGKMHAGLIIMIICEKWSRRGKCQESFCLIGSVVFLRQIYLCDMYRVPTAEPNSV